jgi:hypothetical protein
MAKGKAKVAAQEESIKTTVKEGAMEKKEMKIIDRRVGDVIFDTKVNLQPIYSKDKDKHYLKITVGENQDKVFLVTARSDGKGICVLTDYEDFQYNPRPTISSKI